MPIGDLLASISGGAGKAPTSSRQSPAANIKRKASSELASGGTTSKARRITPPPSRPNPTSRPTSDRAPSSGGPRYAGTAASRPAVSMTSKPARPAPSTSSSVAVAAAAKIAPKKGSFAEILARGKAAQASMGQVGKIQHKKVENPPKRSKEELQEAAAAAQASRGKKPAAASAYGGTSRPSQRPVGSDGARRPGASSSSSTTAARQRPPASGSAVRRRGAAAAAAEPERKVKKAATATTGYAGTARPKPGGDVKTRHDAPRGGALLSGPKVRRAREYDDEFDEDMDDFIDYDEEDDQDGGEPRGFNYASDGSSDMEAGMDDIYSEEDRAARIARQEDIREEKLEKELKAAKEERRRRALDGYR
ncbi:Chromatin SPT2 [Cordyceps fumosorosea ARSEF 2679]|uniref:Chromatin SPT2 n=1 Tax=Cordyceps fumosorosea (strain ARSEF 2679) TaxID=1081104 RepID=A0A168CFN9_CORFA|nr:Chromatin SPT2 [Cordyceps fumosorosea ARSEF 2679]OAA71317.1 Chromatin SPT2 [Cordyceps fumosorosea ARSEF 2679]